MKNTKYKLTTNITHLPSGKYLYQIQALRDVERHGVKKGDLGGWVESEANLAQDGDAWVSGDAWVYGSARVCGDAAPDLLEACKAALKQIAGGDYQTATGWKNLCNKLDQAIAKAEGRAE